MFLKYKFADFTTTDILYHVKRSERFRSFVLFRKLGKVRFEAHLKTLINLDPHKPNLNSPPTFNVDARYKYDQDISVSEVISCGMYDGLPILIKEQHFQARFFQHPTAYPLGDLGEGSYLGIK
jgi:hypothetical protein